MSSDLMIAMGEKELKIVDKKELAAKTSESDDAIYCVEDVYIKLDSIDCIGRIFQQPSEPDQYGARAKYPAFNVLVNGEKVNFFFENKKKKADVVRDGLIEAWVKWNKGNKSGE